MSDQAGPTGSALQQYGGQAVIEGVMMRSPRYFAVACRHPDGSIVVKREAVENSIIGKLKWLNRPFLRGTLALIDAMALGARALVFASNVQMQAEAQERGAAGHAVSLGRDSAAAEIIAEQNQRLVEESVANAASMAGTVPLVVPISGDKPKTGRINDIAIGGSLAFSFAFGILLFVLLPTLLTDRLGKSLHFIRPSAQHVDLRRNLLDGVIRMVLFFGYIGLISFMRQIRRVFQYHGAEHKAINTLEAGLPLTKEEALKASRIHPRCGTSFIFIVLVVNLIAFAFLPRPVWYLRFPLHLLIIPLVAGAAYEIIKFAGSYRKNPLVMAVFAPGMATQYLTTRPPDPDMVEVALAALYSVLEAEGHRMQTPADVQAEPAAALA